MASRPALISVALAALAALAGCAVPGGVAPARVSELALQGDGRFQASQRLVLEGLDADAAGDAARARGRYERALQVDSGNPWAYLALARQHLEAGRGPQAQRHAERASQLFETLPWESPGAQVHCDGIRGAALALQGQHAEAAPLLDAAARAAPAVWGDGQLSAAELR